MATKKTNGIAAAPRMNAEQKAYQAEDDLRTIRRAAEIQSSKGRMSAVQKHANLQIAALKVVAKRK